MNKINKLNKLKNKAILLSSLITFSLASINNTNVYASDNTTKVINMEDENTTSNENNKSETIDEKIEYYSNVYGIKKEYIYDYLDYMYNENSDNEEFLKMNSDLKIITAARHIYDSDEYNKENTRTNKKYVVTLEPEELILKYSSIFESNHEIALSIACAECSEPIKDDWNYRTNGNIAGIGGDMYFENAEIGVIYYIDMLKNKYGVNKDSGSEVFSDIAKTYCPPNWYNWQKNLTEPIYNQINEDYFSRATDELKEKYEGVDYIELFSIEKKKKLN